MGSVILEESLRSPIKRDQEHCNNIGYKQYNFCSQSICYVVYNCSISLSRRLYIYLTISQSEQYSIIILIKNDKLIYVSCFITFRKALNKADGIPSPITTRLIEQLSDQDVRPIVLVGSDNTIFWHTPLHLLQTENKGESMSTNQLLRNRSLLMGQTPNGSSSGQERDVRQIRCHRSKTGQVFGKYDTFVNRFQCHAYSGQFCKQLKRCLSRKITRANFMLELERGSQSVHHHCIVCVRSLPLQQII